MHREVQKRPMILALRLFGQIITAGALFIAGQVSAQEVQRQSTIRFPSAPVTVTNTPLPVTVTNQEAAITPFSGNCTGYVQNNQATCSIDIPAGKQFVMQVISAQLNLNIGFASTGVLVVQLKNGQSLAQHIFPTMLQGQDNAINLAVFVGAHSLTWYFDPTATAVLCSTSVTQNAPGNVLVCNVSGYLQ